MNNLFTTFFFFSFWIMAYNSATQDGGKNQLA